MTEKEKFFALAATDRRRIGYLVATLCIVSAVQFLIAPPGSLVSRWGGIALNVLGVFWSLRPDRAPLFYFKLLPYVWWITALFDGLALIRAVQEGRIATPTSGLTAFSVLALALLAGPLLRLYRQGSKGRTDSAAESADS